MVRRTDLFPDFGRDKPKDVYVASVERLPPDECAEYDLREQSREITIIRHDKRQ